MDDPVTVAYTAARGGRTPPSSARSGHCARCSQVAALTPAGRVVSRTFTGYDGWADPAGAGLCPGCCWLYSTPALRMLPHRVTRDPRGFTGLQPGQLLSLLTTGPLPAGVAITVPLRPGRKHLFASLAWGTIRTDDVNLTWSALDARLLRAVVTLRGHGFGSRMLTEAAPPYQVLRRHPSNAWAELLHLWEALRPWRTHAHPYLDLAAAATRLVTR